ncbi:MAG TPA: HYR domain-containing protein [Thermoanaerobaculia bacterium]|nr:HYR domain-containing protein [Thermoanaerobaculia bacterium]
MKTSMRSMILGWVIVLLLGAVGAGRAQLSPVGNDFRVNTTTAQSQTDSDVAMDDAGNFVVVWQSGPIFGNQNIFAQRYNASGAPLGGEFQVSTFTANHSVSRVGMDANGNFVVTWMSDGQFPPATFSIVGRRYDSAGNPLGGEFEISVGQTAAFEDMAMGANGDFLVAWSGRPAGTRGDNSLYGRLYDSTGTPKTLPFLIYQSPIFDDDSPGVTATPDGGWIVAWRAGFDFTTQNADILAQRFDAAGNPVGARVVVPEPASGNRQSAQVAASSDRIVVAWTDNDGNDGNGSIRARLFDASFAPLTGEFSPSTRPEQGTGEAAAVMDGTGRFVTGWVEFADNPLPSRDGSDAAILARAFDAAGNPQGSDFVVESTAPGSYDLVRLAMTPSGHLVATWTGPDDIFARIFAFNAAPVAQCRNLTVPAGPSCTANASIDNGSHDPDAGDTITLAQSPAGPYALGSTSVTLTVTDNHGASSSCMGTVTVVDATPPAITCPAPLTVNGSTPPGGAVVSFTVSATDACDASPTIVAVPPSGSLFPFGTTTVQATATDHGGNSAQCSFTVTVRTPQGQIAALTNQINALVAAGKLTQSTANPLTNALDNAANHLDKGQVQQTCKQLDNFIQKVGGDVQSGKIAAADGQALINAAKAIQASIGC